MTIRNHKNSNNNNNINNNKLISSVSNALNEFRRAFYYVNYKWFHGHLSGKDAEELILNNGGKNGSYLIRNSQSNPGDFVLSVRIADDKVSHVMIKNTADNKYDIGNGDKFNTLAELIKYYKKYPMVETNGNILYLKQPFNNNNNNNNSRNNNNEINQSKIMINQQQQQLSSDDDDIDDNDNYWQKFNHHKYEEFSNNTRNDGTRPENRNKNRYKNILPFDATRVKLHQHHSDYINANYIQWKMDSNNTNNQIQSNNNMKNYIATQGCLQSTTADFWQMVWQENCQIIVMTTNLMERGQNKCAKYWPDCHNHNGDGEQYGKIIVKNCHEIVNQYYTIREFLISNVDNDNNQVGGNKRRIVYHYHFTAWPDHGVPVESANVLNFLNEVNQRYEKIKSESNQQFPIIVHCSAGIGRTGTLIVIDMLLDQLKNHPEISIKLNMKKMIEQIIQMVRQQRAGMVQTEAQFKFIKMIVQHFIEMKSVDLLTSSDYAQIRRGIGNQNNIHVRPSSDVILRHSDNINNHHIINNNNNCKGASTIRVISDIPLPRPPNVTKPKSLYEHISIGSELCPSSSVLKLPPTPQPPPPPPPRKLA